MIYYTSPAPILFHGLNDVLQVIVALLGLPIASFFYTLIVAWVYGSRAAFYFMLFLPLFGSMTYVNQP